MNPLLRIATAFVCLLSLPLMAQDKSVRIDLMPIAIGAPFTAWHAYKGKPVKLEAFESAMGTPVFYRGPQQLRLYANEADVIPVKGQPTVAPVATVNLPAGSRRVLLLCSASGGKTLVRPYAINDSNLKAGDYRIFNVGSTTAGGVIGSHKVFIKSGKSFDVSEASWRKKGGDVKVRLYSLEGNTSKLVYSTIWGHSSARRTFIFLLASGNSKQPLQVRKFHDVPSVRSVGYEPENAQPSRAAGDE